MNRKPNPFWSKSKRRWVVRMSVGGKRVERSRKTKGEIREVIEDLWQARTAADGVTDYTLEKYAREWLRLRQVRPGTRERYNHWLEHIGATGSIPLAQVRRKAIVALLKSIERVPTRNAVQSMLRTIFDDAIEAELITSNPVAVVRRTKHTKRRVEIFQPDEVKAIQDAADGHHYQAAVEIALEVGLRPGELWALTWADLHNSELSIHSTVSVVENQLTIGETKTKAGRRKIPLSDRMIGILADRRREALREGMAAEDSPMFPSVRRTLTWPANGRAMFRRLLNNAGVAQRHLYTCRHTAASNMLNGGVPLPIVAAILGHKSGEVTLRVYSHLIGTETARATKFWNAQTTRIG